MAHGYFSLIDYEIRQKTSCIPDWMQLAVVIASFKDNMEVGIGLLGILKHFPESGKGRRKFAKVLQCDVRFLHNGGQAVIKDKN